MSRMRFRRGVALAALVLLVGGTAACTGVPSTLPMQHADRNEEQVAPATPSPSAVSPTDQTYTVGDTLVVADAAHTTVWSLTVDRIIANADELVYQDAPAGQRWAILELEFELLSGAANTNAPYSITVAAVGDDGTEYDTTAAVGGVAPDDYYLLPTFQPGDAALGQALVLVPETMSADQWSIGVSGARNDWIVRA